MDIEGRSNYLETFTLKVIYNGMARRVRIPHHMEWSTFESKICGIFSLNPPLITFYKDEMGLSVIVDNNDDFKFFLLEENTGRLEILTTADGAEVSEWTVVRNSEEKRLKDDIANGAISPLTIETTSFVDSNQNSANPSSTSPQNNVGFEENYSNQNLNTDDVADSSIILEDQLDCKVSSVEQSVDGSPMSSDKKVCNDNFEKPILSPQLEDTHKPEMKVASHNIEVEIVSQLFNDPKVNYNSPSFSPLPLESSIFAREEIFEKSGEKSDIPLALDVELKGGLQLESQFKSVDHVIVEDDDDDDEQINLDPEPNTANVNFVSNDQNYITPTPNFQSDFVPVEDNQTTRSNRADLVIYKVQTLRDICFKYEEHIRQCPSLLIVIELFSDQVLNGVNIDFELLERGLQRISQPSTPSKEANSNKDRPDLAGGFGNLMVNLGSTMNNYLGEELIPFIFSKIEQTTRDVLSSGCDKDDNTLEESCSNNNIKQETLNRENNNHFHEYFKNLTFPLSLLRSSILSRNGQIDNSSSPAPEIASEVDPSANCQQFKNTHDAHQSSSIEGDNPKSIDSANTGLSNWIGDRKEARMCYKPSSFKSMSEGTVINEFGRKVGDLDSDEIQSTTKDHLNDKSEVSQEASENEAHMMPSSSPRDQMSQPKKGPLSEVEEVLEIVDQNDFTTHNERQSFDESFERFQSQMLSMEEVLKVPFNFNLFDLNNINFNDPYINDTISPAPPLTVPISSSQPPSAHNSAYSPLEGDMFNRPGDSHSDNYIPVQSKTDNAKFPGFDEVSSLNKTIANAPLNPFGDEFEAKPLLSQPLTDTFSTEVISTSYTNEPIDMTRILSQTNDSQDQVAFKNIFPENIAVNPHSVDNPTNDSGSNINPADVELLAGLNSLREMGFPNDIFNLEALQEFNGDIEEAVEYLIQRQFNN